MASSFIIPALSFFLHRVTRFAQPPILFLRNFFAFYPTSPLLSFILTTSDLIFFTPLFLAEDKASSHRRRRCRRRRRRRRRRRCRRRR